MRNAQKISSGNFKGEANLRDLSVGLHGENNIKIEYRETKCEDVEWSELG
jgi:hypothetical protein